MEFLEYSQFVILMAGLIVMGIPLGHYMAAVFDEPKHWFFRFVSTVERWCYRVINIDANREMSWREYAAALLLFNLCGFVVLFFLQVAQHGLPLNPANLPAVSPWLAFNTAVSFVTNTNWQAYSGETTMSYLTQMLGLGVQNFTSAATGLAVAVALTRAIGRKLSPTIGNFWVDLTRSLLYLLIPLSIILALLLMSQGVIQNFDPYITAKTLEGSDQVLPMGPAASQIAIKQLGTNGGGFFGINSAHPFENPTPLSNLLQLFAILLIPFATPIMFGCMIRNKKHGYALLAAMSIIFLAFVAAVVATEVASHPNFSTTMAMEGKEQRFGVFSSVLWSMATTATSNGSVNAMMSSLAPLSGGLALLNMMLGEVVFGGVGCGLYGMLIFALLTVFIAGLMVGRTPEYLGKKIEAAEIKYAVLGIVVPSAVILLGTAVAVSYQFGLSSLLHHGPHGFSEILYAFTSAAANNGSAFGGLNANTDFFNISLAMAMLLGRYLIIIPVLGIAGSLAQKKLTPPSLGTFPVDGPLFVFLLIGIILIVGALTFLPALCLGPLTEHMLMLSGTKF